MPIRTMVPARAARDTGLSLGDLRVLLALGGYADVEGQNIWASVTTLCADAQVTRSTFFRCIKRLMARGYVTATPRYGEDGRQLTTLYTLVYAEPAVAPAEVPAEGATQVTRGSATKTRRGSATKVAPKHPREHPKKEKKEKKKKARPATLAPTAGETETVNRIWRTFPKRLDPPHDYVRARKAIVTLLRTEGVTPEAVEEAALAYAEDCRKERRAAKYVRAMHNFYADEYWRTFRGEPEVRVDGLTREEWIRARMDVAVFDALAHGVAEVDDAMPEASTEEDPFILMDRAP